MIVSNIALTPLHLSLLGFLTTSARLALGNNLPNILTKPLHFCRLALLTAIVLGIVGGVELSQNNPPQTASTLPRVSIVLIIVVFAILTLFALYFLGFAQLRSHSRILTLGITVALPFLLVRIMYSLLNAFASSTANNFNSLTGSWTIYLAMDVIMEFVVVTVLSATGYLLHIYSAKNETTDMEPPYAHELAHVRNKEDYE
ncbi:hypothetical protein V1505DRAFT_192718 [Lipomyces doorenjongii]